MLKSHGLSIKVEGPGAQIIESLRSAVFVSNHQSAVDILAHVMILPANAHFVAKKELFWIPVFGWGARVVGTIFIDRKKGARENSLKGVTAQLKEGNSVILYPEGTRSPDGQLKDFKRGAAVMAIEAQVPIVPMTIFNSGKLCPKKGLSIAPGEIRIYIDEPIETKNLTEEDRFVLTSKLHQIIENRLLHPPQSLLERA
jgi:1-acyl-sn-glycerol-3-phosphate acyltransferase